MKSKFLTLLFAAVGMAGCATKPAIPLAEMAPVHLCYELVTSDQRRGVEVYQELQRRGESCDKYQQQVALMVQAESQRRAAIGAALMNMGAQQQANQKGLEDAYWGPQRALRQNAPINCTSRTGLGGVVNTTCQ